MNDYITRLDKALCRYASLKTRDKVISDYREFYGTLRNEGKTDEEIEHKLGSPSAILKELAAEDKQIYKVVVFRIIVAATALSFLIANIAMSKETLNMFDDNIFVFILMCVQTAAFTYLSYVLAAHRIKDRYRFLRISACISSFSLGVLYALLGLRRLLYNMSSELPPVSAFVIYMVTPVVFAVVIDIAAMLVIVVKKRRKNESAA